MSEPKTERDEILARVRALRSETTKPNGAYYEELDVALASLYPTLPMKWLTGPMLAAGTAFVGFLYNRGAGLYVYVDSNNKWLYATKSTTTDAVRWKLYQDSVGNLVLNATIGGATMYFNWRNTTGACKLYDSYDQLTAKDWAGETFKILNPNNSEYIGTWSTTDKELYNRTNVSYKEFGFQFFDKDLFTADDHLIYSAYLKERV